MTMAQWMGHGTTQEDLWAQAAASQGASLTVWRAVHALHMEGAEVVVSHNNGADKHGPILGIDLLGFTVKTGPGRGVLHVVWSTATRVQRRDESPGATGEEGSSAWPTDERGDEAGQAGGSWSCASGVLPVRAD